jgi:hypothetical protein
MNDGAMRELRLVLAAPKDVLRLHLGPLHVFAPGSPTEHTLLVSTIVAAAILGHHPTAQQERELLLGGQLPRDVVRGVLSPPGVLHATVFLDALRFTGSSARLRQLGWDDDQRPWVAEAKWTPGPRPVVLGPNAWTASDKDEDETTHWSMASGSWARVGTYSL